MSVGFFKSLHNGEYSNLLTVAAFSNSDTTSLPVKNSYLLKFSDKGEILVVCLSKLY